jgi:signal transduction histidine kinase
MKSRMALEPGILRTFRIFTGVWLALAVFSLAIYIASNGWQSSTHLSLLLFGVLNAGLLLAYLSLPRLPSLLQWAYFPIGIVWATLGPMAQLDLLLFFPTGEILPKSGFLLALQPLLVMFIPLVLIAWQYSLQAVILFCSATFLADFLMGLALSLSSVAVVSPVIGISFIRTVLFLLVGNMIANLMQVQREQRQRLTEANDRLAQYAAALEQLTTSRERNRMARELHDVLAHTMSGVAVELEGVRATLRIDPDQAEGLLGQALQAVRDGLTETRRALQALRASPLEDLGLGLAVRSLAESIAGRAGLQTELQIENDLRDYPMEVQQCFYRVAQEALINAADHAMAHRVQVCMAREGSVLKLSIRDDGTGFDNNSVDLTQKFGLLGMRERVEMICGNLSIVSQVGSGTQITLTYGGNK